MEDTNGAKQAVESPATESDGLDKDVKEQMGKWAKGDFSKDESPRGADLTQSNPEEKADDGQVEPEENGEEKTVDEGKTEGNGNSKYLHRDARFRELISKNKELERKLEEMQERISTVEKPKAKIVNPLVESYRKKMIEKGYEEKASSDLAEVFGEVTAEYLNQAIPQHLRPINVKEAYYEVKESIPEFEQYEDTMVEVLRHNPELKQMIDSGDKRGFINLLAIAKYHQDGINPKKPVVPETNKNRKIEGSGLTGKSGVSGKEVINPADFAGMLDNPETFDQNWKKIEKHFKNKFKGG